MSGDQQAMLGDLTGHVLAFAFIIGIGIAIGAWLGSRRQDKKFVWWPMFIAVGITLLSLIGSQQNGTLQSASSSTSDAGLHAKVQRQEVPAGSKLRTDDASINAVAEQAKQYVAKVAGVALDDIVIKTRILDMNGEKFLLQQGWLKGHLINTEIMTIRNGESLGVNCTSSAEDIEPRLKGTLCGSEVSKALGIDVSKIDGVF